jgi:uncharacterized membrane protein
MSNLVALAFNDEAAADAFMSKLEDMGAEEIVQLEDLVKVTVDETGEAKLHHKASLVTGGAVVGGFLGGIVGLLFLSPVAGAALGAAGGAAIGAASGDYGIDDDFIKQSSEALTPGSAALFMLVKSSVPDRVQAEISGTEATVITTNLSEESEARLRDALA